MGLSDDTSVMIGFGRVDIEGKEFLRATLLFRSRPCEEPGLTRMEGERAMTFSFPEASTTELGGRDGAREVGRDEEPGSLSG